MTVERVVSLLAGDSTTIYIRNQQFGLLTKGNWYQDNVLEYMKREVESFSWQDDDNIYIDLAEEGSGEA